MEVLLGALFKSKSSDSGIPSSKPKKWNLSAHEVATMELGKKRGVYVEKWGSSKRGEGNKTHRKPKLPPPPQTHKLLTSTPAASNISAITRLLGTADPAVRFIKRKPPTTFLDKLSKQSSKTTPTKQSKHGMHRNSIEEKKIRSNIHNLKQKDSSSPTRDTSFVANWSSIFPNKEDSTGNARLLQQYISNNDQNAETAKDKKNEKLTATDAKGEPVYDFFVDLLESVYDEDVDEIPDDKLSSKTSHITCEIDAKAAQKLMSQKTSYHYTIKDDDAIDQSRELAVYYNNRSRLVPNTRVRRKKKIVKCYECVHKNPPKAEIKQKKPNLLNILKEQLSLDFDMQEEPETMYEALLNIAKNKRKHTTIYFEPTTDPSDNGTCMFKRRNVISPSTKLPRNLERAQNFNSNNTTKGKYQSRSLASSDFESRLSLQVHGYDYDEEDLQDLDSDDSDADSAVTQIRPFNLNEGITTVTQHWRR